MTIEFNDGCIANLWDANHYYSWLMQGYIDFPSGKRYSFDDSRPTVSTMFKLKVAIDNYKLKNTKPINAKRIVDSLYYIPNN